MVNIGLDIAQFRVKSRLCVCLRGNLKGMLVSKMIKVIGVGALTTLIGTQVAVAQDDMFRRDRIQGAGERYLPEFEPREVRLGSFKLTPELGLGLQSNSNVYAVGSNDTTLVNGVEEQISETSDIIVSITPALNLTSDWGRHEIGLTTSAAHKEYTDNGDESHTNLNGFLRGRIDVSREFNFTANVGAQELTERRGIFAISQELQSDPAEYSVVTGGIAGNWQRDSLRFSLGANVRDLSYDDIRFSDDALNDGIQNDRSYRDYTLTAYNARAEYALSPDISFFLSTAVSDREYDTVPTVGVKRDASGFNAQIGTSFQSSLLRGEVAVGFLREERDAAEFNDIEGLAIDTDVQWLPTPLTTVSLGVNRYTADTGQIDLPSALVSQGELGVVHELKRNLLLNANARYGVEELDGSATTLGYDQDFYNIGAGAVYKMNPNVHLDFNLQFDSRESSVENRGRTYDQTIVGVGLKLFP